MFLVCQKSKVTIKLKFYYSNLKNAVETAKIAVDSCYVLRQFLTPLPSIDFREIRGLDSSVADWRRDCEVRLSHAPVGGNLCLSLQMMLD
jgi:hypothetical protein